MGIHILEYSQGPAVELIWIMTTTAAEVLTPNGQEPLPAVQLITLNAEVIQTPVWEIHHIISI